MLLGEMIKKIDDLKNDIVQNVANSMEKSLVITRLDEAELWLHRCMPIELVENAVSKS